MKLHVVGIHLGKTVFHLVWLDSTGRVVIRRRNYNHDGVRGNAEVL